MASANDPFASALQDFGGAVTDLFAAKGGTASASSYEEAAALARQNAQITKQSTDIQEAQLSRQLYKTVGKQQAQFGGAGLATSGSALDIMRDSASQGAVAKAITAGQGAITENSYAEQAGMYSGLAKAAKTTSTANTVGGLIQGAGGALQLYNGVTGLAKGVGGGSTIDIAADAGGLASTAGTGLEAAEAGGAAEGVAAAAETDSLWEAFALFAL